MSFNDLIADEVAKDAAKKKPKSKLEEEKLRKKQEGVAKEYFELVGGENEEKGAKATIEFQSKAEKENKELEAISKDILKKSRHGKKKRYIIQLAKQLYKYLLTIDWPTGYRWRVHYDDDRLAVIFSDRQGRKYGQGIKPTGITKYDWHAIGVLATRCENSVDKLQHRMAWQKEQNGFWMPDGSYHFIEKKDEKR